MNYIITRHHKFFESIGNYSYCNLEELNSLPEKIAVDGETTGLSPREDRIFAIQIGTGKDNYLIDLQEYGDEALEIKAEEVFPFLEDKILIFQNGAFDLSFFYMLSFYPSRVRDTMLASKILHNGEPSYIRHDFGSIMERELGLVYDKSEQKNINKIKLSTPKAIQYCFNDVDRLIELHDDLERKLENYGAIEAYRLNCEFIKSMTYLQICGLPISETKWKAKMVEDQSKSKAAQEVLTEYIYKHLPQFREPQLDLFDSSLKISPMFSSQKQMIPVFHALGIPIIDDEGKESIQENVINKSSHEFVSLWLAYKEAEHRVNNFGENVLKQVKDEHIFTSFNPIVDTNRMVSRAGEGNINFLNLPSDKATRSCFEARQGYTMVGCDFDQQEARCLAAFTEDPNSILNIVEKRDPYIILAKAVFPEIADLSDKEVKEFHNEKRQVGKIATLALGFGASWRSLSINLNISEEEAKKIYNAHVELYKEVFVWGENNYQEAIKLGYIESLGGFKLKLPFYNKFKELSDLHKSFDKPFWNKYSAGKNEFLEYKKQEEEKLNPSYPDSNEFKHYMQYKNKVSEMFSLISKYKKLALNSKIQSAAASMSKRAMIYLFNSIKDNNHLNRVKISNFIYDEIQLEVEDELAEQYREILEKCMRDAGDYYVKHPQVKITCTAVIGKNWSLSK